MIFLIYCLVFNFNAAQAETTTTSGAVNLPLTEAFDRIAIAEHVSLESFEGSIQGYVLACEQGANGKIGFCGGECNDSNMASQRGATISRECADFINKSIPQCLLAIGCEKEAAFCGVGGHAKRSINNPASPNSNTPSRHSTGDALDLFGLKCKSLEGTDVSFDFSTEGRSANTQNQQKYDQFVACWRQQVEAHNQQNGNNGGGAISCQGSQPPTNEAHNDHVHISCPVSRNNVAGT